MFNFCVKKYFLKSIGIVAALAMAFCSLPQSASANVVEIRTMRDVLNKLKTMSAAEQARTLVFFDIDFNLIYDPKTTLASDPWFRGRLRQMEDERFALASTQGRGFDISQLKFEAKNDLIVLWEKIQQQTAPVLAENVTLELFTYLKRQRIAHLGLTARTPSMGEKTV